MKILHIYPRFPDTFWSFKHALSFIRKKASNPPLGLVTVAAMFPPEWDQKLVDVNVQNLSDTDLEWADYVFISAMTVQRESAAEVIRRCKSSGTPVVAGGPLFTAESDTFPSVDYLVLNEAEITIAPFLKDLRSGNLKRVYASKEHPSLASTPVPRWDLLDLNSYASMSIQFSRGCPYDCEFCNVTALLGHRPRTKSSQQILAELDSLYSLGWRDSVFFVDDNFIGHRKALKTDLLPALASWRKDKKGVPFYTEASINLVDDSALMDMMTAAGFNKVFIGIETPDADSLVECNKKHNSNRDMVQDVKRIQRSGLQVQGGFIVGFDHDTPSIFQRQIDFIQQSGIVTAMLGMLQAPPGTKLFERMKESSRLLGQLSGDNVDGSTNIIPKMGLEALRKGYQDVLDYIYSPRNYYQRVKTFLREYNPPEIRSRLSFEYLMAFFRSIVKLGIIGKERLEYWKLFFWTLFTRPRSLPEAITLAIYGYHFRKVAELQRV